LGDYYPKPYKKKENLQYLVVRPIKLFNLEWMRM